VVGSTHHQGPSRSQAGRCPHPPVDKDSSSPQPLAVGGMVADARTKANCTPGSPSAGGSIEAISMVAVHEPIKELIL
jgi:hypothetical protein